MNKHLTYSVLFIMTSIACVFYGICIHKYEVFPYGYIKMVYHEMRGNAYAKQGNAYGPWSIGIYHGSTPFDLADPPDISNPVLTGKDVVDIDARFVADPFMVFRNGKYSMFFEALNRKTNQGDIGYAESTDGMHWEYKKIIIDETFHLSYPYVFEWNNDFYLIPETYQDLSVRLYKAVLFPDKWEYIGNLLTGYRYIDPSILVHPANAYLKT